MTHFGRVSLGARSLLWGLIASVAAYLYSLGLPGSFIFDDAPNLEGLARIQPGAFRELLSFSLQGIAGPSGRPISLYSFALQHQDWPGNPGAFKQANILIHLVNGCLLLWVVHGLLKLRAAPQSQLRWIPLLAAGLWLILPIHVSSVLYVVQRMTLLSASFVLMGLAIYLHARSLLKVHAGIGLADLYFLLSLFCGIVLGVLAKENAVVFPLLILSIEATALNKLQPLPQRWLALLWLPIACFAAYLALISRPWLGFEYRSFTLIERLITQARVLWMYVFQIAVPSSSSLHFLYDNYPVSSSLINPFSTLLSILGWITISVSAWIFRKKHQLFAFAVLFFLASHALESTILPLELVFEHRNYLGSAAIALLLALIAWRAFELSKSKASKIILVSGLIIYTLLILICTANVASLWGSPLLQKRLWLENNPDSARVYQEFSSQLLLEGHAPEANAVLEAGAVKFPNHMGFRIAQVELACFYPSLKPKSLQPAIESLRSGKEGLLSAVALLDRIVFATTAAGCPTYSTSEVDLLITSAMTNNEFRWRASDLHLLKGILCSHEGDRDCAKEHLEKALELNMSPRTLIQAATWEALSGNKSEAEKYLYLFELQASRKPREYFALRGDVEYVKSILALESSLQGQQSDSTP